VITKLPRVTPIVNLHKQAGISLKGYNIRRLAIALYQKSATTENSQIQNRIVEKISAYVLLLAR
jgi:cytochrome b561